MSYLNGGVLFGNYSGKIGDPVPSVTRGACCFRWVSRLRTYRDRTAVGNVTNVICISTRVHKGLVAVQSFFMISFKFGHFFDPLSLLHTLCHMPLCHNMPNPPPPMLHTNAPCLMPLCHIIVVKPNVLTPVFFGLIFGLKIDLFGPVFSDHGI